MSDDNAYERDYKLPFKVNLKKLIVPNKKFLLDNAQQELKEYRDRSSDYKSGIQEHEKVFKQFLHNSIRTVNYLVKEFEMRKNARLHARSSTAKTGVIDPLKLYTCGRYI